MSPFSKLLAVRVGAQSFPQPFRRNALIALVFACAISPQFAAAQTGGRIAGAVKDVTGAVVPGSQVVLVNPANGVKQNAVTGNDGVFTFAAVPVGEYELDVTAQGFNPYRQTANLKVDVNTALTVDVVLKVTVAYPTGNPPHGLTYTSPESPIRETPFIGALSGTQYLQQFPVHVPSYNVSPGNPDNNVDWSRYYPISGAGSVYYKNKTGYVMQYNLIVDRQIGGDSLLSVGYIGSLGRHLLTGRLSCLPDSLLYKRRRGAVVFCGGAVCPVRADGVLSSGSLSLACSKQHHTML